MNINKRIMMSRCANSPSNRHPKFDLLYKNRGMILAAGLALIIGGCSSDSSETAAPNSETTAPTSETDDRKDLITSLAALQDASSDENGDPKPVALVPVVPDPVVPDPVVPDPVVPDPVVPDPVVPDPVVPDPVVPDPVVPDPVVPDPVVPDPVVPDPVVPDPVVPDPVVPDPVVPDPVVPDPVVPDPVVPDPVVPDPVTPDPEVLPLPRSFQSHTTPGFSGEVQNNGTIAVTWNAQSGAKGYNVYRNSEFYQTVFDTTLVDVDTQDADSLYYEVQFFTEAKIAGRIASGLTVKLNEKSVELPSHIAADYDLVFEDNFDGNTLDSSKWNTAYLWGSDLVINQELQHYVDINRDPDFGYNPFKLGDGTLTIESIRTPDNLLAKANGQEYLSGVITSYDAFKFTYGYAEARVQVPLGRGLWAAFWLLNAYYQDQKPEIDIMEHLGHRLDRLYHTYHYYDDDGQLRSTESESSTGVDFTGDFHTFAVEWRPGTLIYYIDGIERHRISDPEVSHEEMYILANTALGGWWPGSPDETTQFPASYRIDYIRAYQKRGLLDDPPQFDGGTQVELAENSSTRPTNHFPPFELWPDGFPARPQ